MNEIARSPRQLGALIRKARRQKALSQTALGARTNQRQAMISNIESGEDATRIRTIFDVLAALDLELVVRPRTGATGKDIEDIF